MTIKEKLQEIASRNAMFDDEDCDVMDCCGGNFDDAYEVGSHDGEVALARELLGEFFNET